jgi:hypothetical protein
MPAPLVAVDVEASGPCPQRGDMISFAAIVIEPNFGWSFCSPFVMRSECPNFEPETYELLGLTRERHENALNTQAATMANFEQWAIAVMQRAGTNRLVMVSDNPGFDFGWMNHACHMYLGYNPFGHTARKIGDIYSGLRSRPYETQGWKKLRKAPHDHTPYNDALGNAQAFLSMWDLYGDAKAKADIAKYGKIFQ